MGRALVALAGGYDQLSRVTTTAGLRDDCRRNLDDTRVNVERAFKALKAGGGKLSPQERQKFEFYVATVYKTLERYEELAGFGIGAQDFIDGFQTVMEAVGQGARKVAGAAGLGVWDLLKPLAPVLILVGVGLGVWSYAKGRAGL
jgi:hypothetical protein